MGSVVNDFKDLSPANQEAMYNYYKHETANWSRMYWAANDEKNMLWAVLTLLSPAWIYGLCAFGVFIAKHLSIHWL